MTDRRDRQQRSILRSIAHRAMLARGLLPDFSAGALAELDGIHEPATRAQESTRDLRHLIWCSIDNDDSRDLDQLTVAEAMPRSAIGTGLVNYVLVPEKIPAQLMNYAKASRPQRSGTATALSDKFPETLEKIFHVLQSRTGHAQRRNADSSKLHE